MSHLLTTVEDVDNAEGSSGSRELSYKQEAVLVGTLLGDGCLARHGQHHRLHIKHKAAHRALVEFKYRVFEDFTSMRLHGFDQQLNGKRYPCLQFATRTSSVFSKWHDRFYRLGKKVVPHEIERFLSPLALGVWFMDDGAADHAGATIQTHNFRAEEVDRLKAVMNEKFDLAISMRANRGRHILYVPTRDLEVFGSLIRPYLLREFSYKLTPTRARTP